jgi:signal transduction histidine kinase
LIDNKATNELIHRLMQLERQHLSETRVVDQQTRRTLHDEILPRIQSLMIKMSGSAADNNGTLQELGDIHHQLSELMRDLPALQDPELARLGLVEALKRSVEYEFKAYFNTVTWQVNETVIENARTINPYAANVVYHAGREAIRNSAIHGQVTGSDQPINLSITMLWKDGLILKIVDDGVGFVPGKNMPQEDGHGMSLHSTLMAIVGGSITWESSPGKFTLVTINLPVRLMALKAD